MRSPIPPRRCVTVLATVGSLLLVGCGGGDDDASTAEPVATDAPTTTDPDTPDETTDPDDTSEPDSSEPDTTAPTSDLPDGVAATVDGTEIERGTVTELFDELADAPIFEAQLDDDPDRFEATLRAQILSQLVVSQIVLRGAEEDFDIEVSQDDLDAALDAMVQEAGGPDEFEAQLQDAGLTREVFVKMELPLTTLLQQLESEFGDLGAEPGEMSEGQAALQEWGVEKFAAADVAVDPGLGTWNPDAGQIQPPS